MNHLTIKQPITLWTILSLLITLTPTHALAIDCEEFLANTQPGEIRTCEEREEVNVGAIVGIVVGVALVVGLVGWAASAASDSNTDNDNENNSLTSSHTDIFKKGDSLSLTPDLYMTEKETATGLKLKYRF